MKLILKEDVLNLGFKDDIVVVKNGYGRNFLIPKGKAVIATTSAIKVIEEKSIVDQASKKAEKIKALKIKLSSKVGSEDKLFGSITNSDLAEAISKKIPDIEKKHISIPGKSIKRLGKYVAKIRIHRDVNFDFPFEVIPEEKTNK